MIKSAFTIEVLPLWNCTNCPGKAEFSAKSFPFSFTSLLFVSPFLKNKQQRIIFFYFLSQGISTLIIITATGKQYERLKPYEHPFCEALPLLTYLHLLCNVRYHDFMTKRNWYCTVCCLTMYTGYCRVFSFLAFDWSKGALLYSHWLVC